MSHPHRTLRLATAAIGAATLALTATSAHASAPSTVSVAGSTAGITHYWQATSTGDISFTFAANPIGTAPMSCPYVTAGGTITDGPQSWYPWNNIATINDTLDWWSGCTGLGLNLAVSQLFDGHVGITGDTFFGDTPVIIPDVSAEVRDLDFGGQLCDLFVDGSVTGAFDNSSQSLSITGSSLNVTVDPYGTGADCAGQVVNGGNATLAGTFRITDANGVTFPIVISS